MLLNFIDEKLVELEVNDNIKILDLDKELLNSIFSNKENYDMLNKELNEIYDYNKEYFYKNLGEKLNPLYMDTISYEFGFFERIVNDIPDYSDYLSNLLKNTETVILPAVRRKITNARNHLSETSVYTINDFLLLALISLYVNKDNPNNTFMNNSVFERLKTVDIMRYIPKDKEEEKNVNISIDFIKKHKIYLRASNNIFFYKIGEEKIIYQNHGDILSRGLYEKYKKEFNSDFRSFKSKLIEILKNFQMNIFDFDFTKKSDKKFFKYVKKNIVKASI